MNLDHCFEEEETQHYPQQTIQLFFQWTCH